MLGRLHFDDEVLDWVRDALRASHADERREHEAAIRRLHAEHQRLGDRINAMYLDKLDGRVDGAFFDKMSAEWRAEQNRCLREIERHGSAVMYDAVASAVTVPPWRPDPKPLPLQA